MAVTEDYNGICPKCSYDRCLVRYGSVGYFHFFACPSCKFAFGNNGTESFSKREVWKSIIEGHKNILEEKDFGLTIGGLKMMVESFEEPIDAIKIEEHEDTWEIKYIKRLRKRRRFAENDNQKKKV